MSDTINIFIWGTGELSNYILDNGFPISVVTSFVDNSIKSHLFRGKKVIAPDMLLSIEYDLIIVASTSTEEIYEQCIYLGIDTRKVYFLCTHSNRFCEINNKYITQNIGDFLAHLLNETYQKSKLIYDYIFNLDIDLKERVYLSDIIRYKAFEMCARMIKVKNIEGNVAECGVFRGDFARYINYEFSDRIIYLFDTFEGFQEKDIQLEPENGIDEIWCEKFKNTNVDYVINKMFYKDKVVIRKGWFPDTANGLETERYVFVSLDTDFEAPIYNGLKFFYPRLKQGGYIFIHDCCCNIHKGVSKAVSRYEDDEKITLHKMPLCDRFGTLIITK